MIRVSLTLALLILPSLVLAHAGSQGLILLLPTEFYIVGGGITVVVTIFLAAVLSHEQLTRLFTPL